MKTIYMLTWHTHIIAADRAEALRILEADTEPGNIHLFELFDTDAGALCAYKKTIELYTREPRTIKNTSYKRYTGVMMKIYRGCPDDLIDPGKAEKHCKTIDIISFVPDITE